MRKLPPLHAQLDSEPRSDRDRLIVADQALEVAEAELAKLGCDENDLAYLMEVLRLGVRHALSAEIDDHEVVAPVLEPTHH